MRDIVKWDGRSLIDGIGDLEEADVWYEGEGYPGEIADVSGLAAGNGPEPMLEHNSHEKDERAEDESHSHIEPGGEGDGECGEDQDGEPGEQQRPEHVPGQMAFVGIVIPVGIKKSHNGDGEQGGNGAEDNGGGAETPAIEEISAESDDEDNKGGDGAEDNHDHIVLISCGL